MTNKNIVCGIDVHKEFLIGTILGEGDNKKVERYETDHESILKFRDWLRENRCERAVIESTGVYWVPVFLALEGVVDIVVANAYQVKQIPGRKTDESDSEWLAKLLRGNLIRPSYIPERNIRDLRDLTRLRTKLVHVRTDFKNRVHKVLERANIRLSAVLSDLFGKTGLQILKGITSGKSLDEVIGGIKNKRIDKKEVEEAIKGNLSESDVFLLEYCVKMVEILGSEIAEIENKIEERIKGMEKELKIVMSVVGVGKTAAQEILAEVGDIKRFPEDKNLASRAGLAPSVYQSGGKNLTGRTRKGSKWLRKTMFQVAMAASRNKKSELREFYLRIKAKKGHKVAIVALARKILCIIHHLLTTGNATLKKESVKSP